MTDKVTVTAFLSTPSARRATFAVFTPASDSSISIHALREEGDVMRFNNDTGIFDFYPRPPRGGRRISRRTRRSPIPISIHALREEGDPLSFTDVHNGRRFLSTPSARRATWSGNLFTNILI